ncbi:autotransporter domain-containing protein [Xanthobacter sp. V2C-8]|uniref:autotransporter domain-containing protein n=4 Tax=Xanthobacter albus TaxID=3119929 RepID=UPI00372C3EE8
MTSALVPVRDLLPRGAAGALPLLVAGLLGTQPASAGCTVEGTTTLSHCDTDYVSVFVAPGTGALTVDGVTTGYVAYVPPSIPGIYDQTLNLTGGTVIDSTTHTGVVMQQAPAPGVTMNSVVNIESGVRVTSVGGDGAVWLRNDNAGTVTINNAGTLQGTTGTLRVEAFTLSGVTNLGAVTITNSGTVTAANNRGIYADGNHDGATAATVSVTNTATGTVTAYTAGIRVIDYLGLATIDNAGTVNATLQQGLIAWSNNGDATITNSGTVTSGNDNAIYAATETGKATVTNSGSVTAEGDPALDADHAALKPPQGYNGLRGSADTTGDIAITNTITGTVEASRDSGIRAETPQGDVTIVNAGQITALTGIVANSGLASGVTNATVATIDGAISVTNSGTVNATDLAVSLDGTTNELINTGSLVTTGATAVQTGNGNTTVFNSGTISAGSASGTAISMGSGSNRLVLADTSVIVGRVVNAGSGNTLELTGTGTGTLSLADVGGSGAYQGFADLDKSGTGQWTLTGGGSSLTGTVNVKAGTLALASGGQLSSLGVTIGGTAATSGAVIVDGATSAWTVGANRIGVGVDGTGTLTIRNGASVTSPGAVLGWNATGDGSATVTGPGSSWTNTAALYVGNLGAGHLSVLDGGVVTSTDAYVGTISGAQGTVSISGAGSAWTLSGAFIAGYESGTTANVTLSAGGRLSAVTGTLGDLNGASGTMTVTGAGSTWTAVGDGTGYSGYMNIGRLGDGSLTVTDGGAVEAYRLYIGNDTGSTGTVTVSGAGSSVTTASNLYIGTGGDGTLTVSNGAQVSAEIIKIAYFSGVNGTLNVGAAAGQAAVAAGAVSADEILFLDGTGKIVLNHTDTGYVLGAAISGTGEIDVLSGTTILSGASTYSGATRVTGGKLVVTGSILPTGGPSTMDLTVAGGAVEVSGGGLLSTRGAFIGGTSGTSAVTVTGAGSTWVNGDWGVYLSTSAGQSGTLTVSDGASLQLRTGALFMGAGGVLSVSGAGTRAEIGDPAVPNGRNWLYANGGVITVSGGASLYANGAYVGGDGGALATMTLTGQGTTLNAEERLYVGGQNGTYDLNPVNGNGALTVSAGATATAGTVGIGMDPSSTGTLLLTGAGSQVWAKANAAITPAPTLGNFYVGYNGAALVVVADGATLKADNEVRIAYDTQGSGVLAIGAAPGAAAAAAGRVDAARVVFGAGAGALVFNHTDAAYVFAAEISGGGSLTQAGSGTTILTGASSYTGGTSISGGTLQIGNGGTSGSIAGNITDNATLVFNRADDITYSGVISGTGTLLKAGAGTLVLTGSNTYAGGTTITAGTLQIGNGGTSGWIAGDVANAGALAFERADDITYSGAISGTGTLLKAGAGTLVLTGSNTYTGGTTIAAGTLQIGNGGTLGAITGDIVNTGALVFSRADDSAYSGAISGTGSLLKAGAGTLVMTGNSSYTGGTTISGGTLQIGNGGTSGAIAGDITDNAALAFSRADDSAYSGVISGTGSLLKAGAGTLVMTGSNTYAGGTTISGGTLQIGNGGTSGSIAGDVANTGTLAFNRADDITFAGAISGSGSVVQQGTGTLTLSGASTFSGGLRLASGTVRASSAAALGAGPLALQGSAVLSVGGTFVLGGNVTLSPAGGTGGGTFQVDGAQVLTLSGVVSGAGGLTKTGAGTLVLTGSNTYAGGTTIAAGTLQIGNGGASGAIVGDVLNTGALVFNRADNYTFTGSITGDGDVSFTGGGTVVFSAPYQGPVTVNDATVKLVPGTVTTSPFSVNAGGSLGGTATIGALTVNSGGTVAPGYSPGTLTVSGAVAFNAGSVYRVDVTPAGAHDLIIASGDVTISSGATVAVNATAGRYPGSSLIPILTTSGTVNGTFGGATSDYVFLAPTLTYDAQNVYLSLIYNGVDFITYARTPNEAAAALAAQALGGGNPVYDAILALPEGAVAPAFNALSGEIYASVGTVLQQEAIYVRQAVNARLRQAAAGADALARAAAAAGPATARLSRDLDATLWAHGYGGWGNSFGNGNAATISNSLGGFLMGADVALAPNAWAGVFGGYSRSSFDVNARASSGNSDNYDLGAYAGVRFDALALRGGFAYGWHDVSTSRQISVPGLYQSTEGGYSLGTTQLFGEVAYGLPAGAATFEPFAALAYVNVGGASFSEALRSGALAVESGSMDTLYGTLGLRAAFSTALLGRTLTPSVTLGWQHAFGDTTPAAVMRFLAGTTPFSVSGVPIAEDALLVDAGLAYDLSDVASLSVAYTGQFAASSAQNAFTAQLSVRF